MTAFSAARSLADFDALPDFSGFDSGLTSVDTWLAERAEDAELRGSARTFVVTTDHGRVAGFYCLSMTSIARNDGPKRFTTNMPKMIPAVLIGRLARDKQYAGVGLGTSLMQDAMTRAVTAARTVGAVAILVDADPGAVPFYESCGFQATRVEGQMYVTMVDVEATLQQMGQAGITPSH